MKKYPKIDSLYKRDTNKELMIGHYTCPEFEYLNDCEWVATEKVDGTNIRVGMTINLNDDAISKGFTPTNLHMFVPDVDGVEWNRLTTRDFEFRGRTDNAQIPQHLMDKLKSIFEGKEEMVYDKFERRYNFVIYGEGYGPKINGGEKYSSTPDFVVFDIRIGDWWMRRPDVESICTALGLRVAPLLGVGTLDYWVEYVSQGFNSTWGDFQAEGVVLQPEIPLLKRNGDRLITKLCCRDYQS